MKNLTKKFANLEDADDMDGVGKVVPSMSVRRMGSKRNLNQHGTSVKLGIRKERRVKYKMRDDIGNID